MDDYEEYESNDIEKDDSIWDTKEIADSIYNMKDEECIGMEWYKMNAPALAGKIRKFVREKGERLSEDRQKRIILKIYYSLCRAFQNKRIAMCEAIGFNGLFKDPLSNREFYDVLNEVDAAEHMPGVYSARKGLYWSEDLIEKETGISKKELGIGSRAIRRENSENYHSSKAQRDKRMIFLFETTTMTDRQISALLLSEGYKKAGDRTVYNKRKKWQEEKMKK